MTTLTLTILSGVALLVLLLFLGWALAKIGNALQSVTMNLQNIAMGVRAIETETSHLIPAVAKLNTTFGGIAGGFDSVEQSLRKLA